MAEQSQLRSQTSSDAAPLAAAAVSLSLTKVVRNAWVASAHIARASGTQDDAVAQQDHLATQRVDCMPASVSYERSELLDADGADCAGKAAGSRAAEARD